MGSAAPDTGLERVLAAAQGRSLIGRLPIPEQIAHSEGFLRVLDRETLDGPALELGSGGGLPGLVVAVLAPDIQLVLLDSSRRSTEFLTWAIEQLDLSPRVQLITARAEEAGRDPQYRGQFAAVLARSFARPAVTAECAAPFLRVGGRLVVSEPPSRCSIGSGREGPLPTWRWPAEGLAGLGLAPELELRDAFGFAVVRQRTLCPSRYPRRVGIPAKRPLFS